MNNNIDEKGLYFIRGGFRKGIWYYFDEEGNLTDAIDHDKDYPFTFEQVLDFAEKEGIKLLPFDVDYKLSEEENNVTLSRCYSPTYKKHVWILSYLHSEDFAIEDITLDGATGEILKRESMELLLDL